MRTALTLPRVRGPGLGWLPEVLRKRATWLTVWRFLWAGPLIGTLPYAYVWPEVNWFYMGVVAAHGVPAAVVLGLMQKPAQRPLPTR